MSRRLDELALRRARLITRAAEQREALAIGGSALVGDRLLFLGRVVAAHPAWVVAVAVALGVIIVRRRRAAAVWAGRVWTAWRVWQIAQMWLTPRATH